MQREIQGVFDSCSQSTSYNSSSHRSRLQRSDCDAHVANCGNCRHILLSDQQCSSDKTLRGRPHGFFAFCDILLFLSYFTTFPSVLCRCWWSHRKGIRPVTKIVSFISKGSVLEGVEKTNDGEELAWRSGNGVGHKVIFSRQP